MFCSSRDVPKKYQDAAREFATLIGQNGHTLLWGGSNVGTMKIIADAAQAAGGKIIGVSMELLKEQARANADEMIIASTLAERKAKLLERGDSIIALPGGLGTLDEITEIMELKKHAFHDKPIVFLNTDGFYDGLQTQLERMHREKFLPEALSEYVSFVQSPQEAMKYIEAHGS